MLQLTGQYRIGVIQAMLHATSPTKPDKSSCSKVFQLLAVEGALELDLCTVLLRREVIGQLTHVLLMYQIDLYWSYPWHMHFPSDF